MTLSRSSGLSPALDTAIDDYLSGRLSEEERVRLERLMAEDPEVRRRVESLKAQEDALRLLGADILDEPLPGRLLDALGLAD